jgi:prepilin signal peptidase PulO-like enzyme (type II secretory pathway)
VIDLFFAGILIIVLIILSWIDFKTFLLPDYLTLPLLMLGLMSNSLAWIEWTSPLSSWIGAIAGWGSIYILNLTYRSIKGVDGIGMGDAKLLAALGAFLGWETLPYILIIASCSGLLGGYIWLKMHQQDNTQAFPFGPFIALGGIITVLWTLFKPII